MAVWATPLRRAALRIPVRMASSVAMARISTLGSSIAAIMASSSSRNAALGAVERGLVYPRSFDVLMGMGSTVVWSQVAMRTPSIAVMEGAGRCWRIVLMAANFNLGEIDALMPPPLQPSAPMATGFIVARMVEILERSSAVALEIGRRWSAAPKAARSLRQGTRTPALMSLQLLKMIAPTVMASTAVLP